MAKLQRPGEVQIGRVLRLDRRAALELLRDLARDRGVLVDLRRLWAKETAATTLCFTSDEHVLAQLAERVASGSLVIARVRPPLPRAPPPGAGAVDGATTAEPAKQEEKPKDKPALVNPRWSVDRVEVGAEVDAVFTYVGCDPGQPVTLKIYEVNANGTRKQVDTTAVPVPARSGDHKTKWKRDSAAASADLKEDEEEGDTGPVEYRFTVEADGVTPTELSGPLWLTNTVEIDLVGEYGQTPAEDGVEVVLRTATGEELRASSAGGKVRFKRVVIGPLRFELSGHAELVNKE